MVDIEMVEMEMVERQASRVEEVNSVLGLIHLDLAQYHETSRRYEMVKMEMEEMVEMEMVERQASSKEKDNSVLGLIHLDLAK